MKQQLPESDKAKNKEHKNNNTAAAATLAGSSGKVSPVVKDEEFKDASLDELREKLAQMRAAKGK